MSVNRPQRHEGMSDVIPGVLASLAFIVMILLLGPSWMLASALLAFGVYFGTRFLLPTPAAAPEATPFVPTQEVLRQVAALAPQVGYEEARWRLKAICEKADALLRYADQHPDRSGDSLAIIRQYLELTRTGVQLFLEANPLSGNQAQQSRARLNELLTNVQERLTQLYEWLNAEEDAALAGRLKALTQTLKELDEVSLTLGQSSRGEDRGDKR